MRNLEDWVNFAFKKYEVSLKDQELIKSRLIGLKNKDPFTYAHTIRVAFLATEIAKHLGYDARAFLFAGLEHDLGKKKIPDSVLKKKTDFSKEDMATMRKHVEYSYEELKNTHLFTAEMVVRHHRFQENPYPKELPKPNEKFSGKTLHLINMYSSVFALADYYDAISTRKNNKFGGKLLTQSQIKQMLIKARPEHSGLIEELFRKGIFGNKTIIKVSKLMKARRRSVRNSTISKIKKAKR